MQHLTMQQMLIVLHQFQEVLELEEPGMLGGSGVGSVIGGVVGGVGGVFSGVVGGVFGGVVGGVFVLLLAE